MYWIEIFGDPELTTSAQRKASRLYSEKKDAWDAARAVNQEATEAQVFVSEGQVNRDREMSIPVLEQSD